MEPIADAVGMIVAMIVWAHTASGVLAGGQKDDQDFIEAIHATINETRPHD